MAHVLRFSIPSALIAVIVACSSSSSSPPAPDYKGSCDALGSQCHGVKTPLGEECHDLGHAGDDSKCGPRKAECLAACPESAHADGGHEADAGPSGEDAGADATADASDGAAAPCVSYCGCMKTACAAVFADDNACLAACAAFSVDDRTCFAGHCEDAKTAADPAHDCDHASGAAACH